MSVKGVWGNSYGSIMSLEHEDDGRVCGSYRSTTGSTGTYYVLGYADPREATCDSGRSVSLSIFWRSIGDDTEDPSWHWVSAQGGQLVGQGPEARLLLMHDMVATVEFPGQAGIGRHIDKLIFEPVFGAVVAPVKAAAAILAEEAGGRGGDLGEEWVESGDDGGRMRLHLLNERFGFASAELELYGRSCEAWGFLDTYAGTGGQGLQAVSLSAPCLTPRLAGPCRSRAGSIRKGRRWC